jgi:hypothetical protein
MLAALALINRLMTTVVIRLQGAEKEIELIQGGSQIKRKKDIYQHGLKHISIICHLPHPPCFSLVTAFNTPDFLLVACSSLDTVSGT